MYIKQDRTSKSSKIEVIKLNVSKQYIIYFSFNITINKQIVPFERVYKIVVSSPLSVLYTSRREWNINYK